MATWSRRTRVTTHIEWLVPFGVVGELNKAERAAWVEYCRQHNRNPDASHSSDDWATFYTDDEHVIIRIEVSKVQSVS